MDGWSGREREVKLLVGLDSSVETRQRVGEGEEEEEEEGLGLEEAVCCGTSAAAASGMLASLATGQCGVGGGMLGSDLNTISLCGERNMGGGQKN